MNMEKRPKKKDGKSMKKSTKVFLIVGLVILVLLGTCVGLFFHYFGGLNTEKLSTSDLDVNTELNGKYGNQDIVNIALFGLDTRGNDDSGRSDAIMIASIDFSRGKIKLTSIARDTYVTIPGRDGKTKINHAYAYGGPELAIKTLNYNFQMNIEDYVTVNFEQLASVIDAAGGVDITITEAERVSANKNIREISSTEPLIQESGTVHLTGAQAVGYSRIREIGGDDARTNRQRTVLNALFEKALTLSWTEYPGLAKEIIPMVKTSLTYGDIMQLATIMTKSPTLEQTAFPHEKSGAHGETINGTWYYVYDLDLASQMLHTFIYEDIHPDDQEIAE